MRAGTTRSTRTASTGAAACCSSRKPSSTTTRRRIPTSTFNRFFKRANALQKILRAAYSWITSQDDLIGNAIEDVVVGEYHSGFNWVVRGDANVTNGWLKLQMR